MFRRNEDEKIASQPQQPNTQPAAQAQINAQAPAAAKPTAPTFGAFGSSTASSSEASSEPKKPVTAPLTTQQVALGTSGAASTTVAPAPKPPASSAQAPQGGNAAFVPSYNKVPAPTQAPATIPSPAGYQSPASSKMEGIEAERRLTVGYGITLTGEVSDCDRLVIYGKVNAKLANVKFLQISDSGRFNGSAIIENAEISGVFEGELKVSHNITITSTGRVNGKITYGSIEIRPGGKFTGEIIEDTSALGANNQQSGSLSPQSAQSSDSKDYYGLNSSGSASTSEAA